MSADEFATPTFRILEASKLQILYDLRVALQWNSNLQGNFSPNNVTAYAQAFNRLTLYGCAELIGI